MSSDAGQQTDNEEFQSRVRAVLDTAIDFHAQRIAQGHDTSVWALRALEQARKAIFPSL